MELAEEEAECGKIGIGKACFTRAWQSSNFPSTARGENVLAQGGHLAALPLCNLLFREQHHYLDIVQSEEGMSHRRAGVSRVAVSMIMLLPSDP